MAARDSDEEVWAWIKARMRPRSATEIMAFNHQMMTRTPDDDTARERYWQFMADIGQSHRTDLTRQFDRLDLDEDRDVPLGPWAAGSKPSPSNACPLLPLSLPASLTSHYSPLSPSPVQTGWNTCTCAGRVDTFGVVGGKSGHIWPESGHIWPKTEHIRAKTEHLAANTVNTCAGRGMPRDANHRSPQRHSEHRLTHDPITPSLAPRNHLVYNRLSHI